MPNIDKKMVIQKYFEHCTFMGGVKETFFPKESKLMEQRIDFHKYIAKRGASPFSTGGVAPNYQRNQITSNMYHIPEISEQVAIDDDTNQTVIPGINPYRMIDTMPPKDFYEFLYATAELRDRIRRREELMCTECMTTGKITIPTTNKVEFERDAKYNLLTEDWSVSTPGGVMETIGKFFELSHEANLPQSEFVLLLGTRASERFFKNQEIANILDNRRYEGVKYEPGPVFGSLYNLGRYILPKQPMPVMVYTYTETYEDADGNEQSIFDPDSAVFTSMQCPRYSVYGGISYSHDTGERSAKQVTMQGDEVIFDTYSDQAQRATFNRGCARFLPIPSNINHLIHASITTS